MEDRPAHILLYDGVCNLCNSLVGFVIRNDPDRLFKFASLQSVTGQRLLRAFGLPLQDLHSFVFISGDTYFLRSAAVLEVLRKMRRPWKWLYPLITLPAGLRDLVYRMIARSRYRIFGKKDRCILPDVSVRERFLDWEEAQEINSATDR
jgi:predicted DCC family thiol-disulfide oxidoreductase YuxK